EGPAMEIRSPTGTGARGLLFAEANPDVQTRTIVGQVTAAAGLLSLTVNDHSLNADKKGMFQADVPLDHDGTKVTVVAVDQAGKRGTLDFLLKPEEMRGTTGGTLVQGQTDNGEPAVIPVPSVDFGKYYALIIGNDA